MPMLCVGVRPDRLDASVIDKTVQHLDANICWILDTSAPCNYENNLVLYKMETGDEAHCGGHQSHRGASLQAPRNSPGKVACRWKSSVVPVSGAARATEQSCVIEYKEICSRKIQDILTSLSCKRLHAIGIQ